MSFVEEIRELQQISVFVLTSGRAMVGRVLSTCPQPNGDYEVAVECLGIFPSFEAAYDACRPLIDPRSALFAGWAHHGQVAIAPDRWVDVT